MLSDIRSKKPIEEAVAEFDSLGRVEFLRKYGFGESRSYLLKLNDKLYDSKAIVGAAHQYATGRALKPAEFSGGEATVSNLLRGLGFDVVVLSETPIEPLDIGDRLTNDEIRTMFNVGNMGGMRRSRKNNVLILISDSTKGLYQDRWQGDVLLYTGMGTVGDQRLNAQNKTVAESGANGINMHLFEAHSEGAYVYSGIVELCGSPFQEHQPDANGQDRLVWVFPLMRKRTAAPVFLKAEAEAEVAGAFDPNGIEDARSKVIAAIVRRRGQRQFRDSLLKAYGQKCAITNSGVPEILDAAHIYPYKGAETNDIRNGILLRTDLHTLFDLGLLAIDTTTWSVVVAKRLHGTNYGQFHGRRLRVPKVSDLHPSKEALDWHRSESGL